MESDIESAEQELRWLQRVNSKEMTETPLIERFGQTARRAALVTSAASVLVGPMDSQRPRFEAPLQSRTCATPRSVACIHYPIRGNDAFPVEVPARILDRRGRHQSLGPWRRHRCGQEKHHCPPRRGADRKHRGRLCRVTVLLPLSLAIINGFQIGVGRSVFVLLLDAVEECVECSTDSGHDYTSRRGEVLPFIELRNLSGIAEPQAGVRASSS